MNLLIVNDRIYAPLRAQFPKSLGIPAEDRLLRLRRKLLQPFLHDTHCMPITGRNKAYGPVGADHQTFSAECLEDQIEIRGDLVRFPVLPIRFRHKTRQLTKHIWELTESANSLGPMFNFTGFDGRLRHVIEDESLARKSPYKLSRDGKMLCVDQDVVCKVKLFQYCDPS